MTGRHKRTFRITDNDGDERAPYALLDDSDTVVRVHHQISVLSDLAFDLGADEVRHDENLVTADERFRRGKS